MSGLHWFCRTGKQAWDSCSWRPLNCGPLPLLLSGPSLSLLGFAAFISPPVVRRLPLTVSPKVPRPQAVISLLHSCDWQVRRIPEKGLALPVPCSLGELKNRGNCPKDRALIPPSTERHPAATRPLLVAGREGCGQDALVLVPRTLLLSYSTFDYVVFIVIPSTARTFLLITRPSRSIGAGASVGR